LAAATPEDFRFSVKAPREITHLRKLENCEDLFSEPACDLEGLGDRLGPILAQTPPSLPFNEARTAAFLNAFRARLDAPIVIELRHPSWFTEAADRLLADHGAARVAADPEPVPGAGLPGGDGCVYFRLHGSPVMYRSAYGRERLKTILDEVLTWGSRDSDRWVIFDNTAMGEAAADALALSHMTGVA